MGSSSMTNTRNYTEGNRQPNTVVEQHDKLLNKICDEPTSGTLHLVQVLLFSKKVDL